MAESERSLKSKVHNPKPRAPSLKPRAESSKPKPRQASLRKVRYYRVAGLCYTQAAFQSNRSDGESRYGVPFFQAARLLHAHQARSEPSDSDDNLGRVLPGRPGELPPRRPAEYAAGDPAGGQWHSNPQSIYGTGA